MTSCRAQTPLLISTLRPCLFSLLFLCNVNFLFPHNFDRRKRLQIEGEERERGREEEDGKRKEVIFGKGEDEKK